MIRCLCLALLALVAAAPAGFEQVDHTRHDAMEMTQFVPHGQTLQTWSEMITTQVFDTAAASDPAALLVAIGGQWMSQCPMTRRAPIERSGDARSPVAMLTLNCPRAKATGKPEYTVFRAMRRSGRMVIAQYAFRYEPDDSNRARATAYLRTMAVP